MLLFVVDGFVVVVFIGLGVVFVWFILIDVIILVIVGFVLGGMEDVLIVVFVLEDVGRLVVGKLNGDNIWVSKSYYYRIIYSR